MRRLLPLGVVLVTLELALSGCSRKAADPAAEEGNLDAENSKLLVQTPTFTMGVSPALVKLTPGGTATVEVRAVRNGEQDPIAVALSNLPAHVSTSPASIAAGQSAVVMEIRADAKAVLGDTTNVAAQGSVGSQRTASPPFTVRVAQPVTAALSASAQQAPFTLKVEPATVKVMQGGTTKVTVTLTRRNDFQAPVSLELRNLPARVTAAKGIIPMGQTSVNLEVSAAADAAAADKADVNVLATATDASSQQVVSPNLTLSIQGRPASFILKADPAKLRLPQGGKATLRVTAARYDNFDGPITVELRNLPAGVSAPKAVINQGQTQVNIDVTATTAAAIADKSDVNALGTTTDASNQQMVSPNFTISVQSQVAPFTVQTDPAILKLTQGGRALLTVLVSRDVSYQGSIQVQLQQLPAQVTASATTIAAGQNQATIEVRAAATAPVGDKRGVYVLATASAAGNQQISSPSFTVSVRREGQPASPPNGIAFELKVSPGHVKLVQGAKAKIKIAVVRKDSYQGPIEVELRHLPAHVTASKVVIAAGQNSGEIDVSAASNAAAEQGEVEAHGIALAADNQEHASPRFLLTVSKKKK